MNVIITGSTGMLGAKLAEEVRMRGGVVTGIDLQNTDLNVDMTDDAALLAALHGTHVDVLVNCAAIVDMRQCEDNPWSAWQLNARTVGVLAEYCRLAGIKLVQVSTEHYYSDDGNVKHNEEAGLTFLNEYARSKYAGEAFAATCPNALILRTNIVGFRGHGKPTFAEWVFESVSSDSEMTLFEDSYVSSLDVNAFSKALLDLIAAGSSGLFNVASSEVFSKRDFILAVARQLGVQLTRAETGSVYSLPVKRANSCGLDVGKAETALGYSMPGLDDVATQLVKEWNRR